jgi:hypothetical protein
VAEAEIIQPLASQEINEGIITKVAEALFAALNSTCNLYGVSYPKFHASGKMELWFEGGQGEIADAVTFEIPPEPGEKYPAKVIVTLEIPETPPNIWRRATGQGIPVAVTSDDGSVEQKAVFFKQKPRNMGRADRDAE